MSLEYRSISTSGSMGSMETPPEEEFPVDEGLESAVLAILCYEVDGIANLLLDAQALAPLALAALLSDARRRRLLPRRAAHPGRLRLV